MKQGTLVRTQNVIAADKCIEYLLTRPKLEMVGLGLLYGRPGLGKTTYASRCRRNLKVHQKRNYRLHHSED